MVRRILALAALSVASVYGAADCKFTLNLTATNPSVLFNNQDQACGQWVVNIFVQGFGSVNVHFESAPNSAQPGVPGAFTEYTANGFPYTLASGNTQAVAVFNGGVFPWVRVRIDTITGAGLVSGQVYGVAAVSQNSVVSGLISNAAPIPFKLDLFGNQSPAGVAHAQADGISNTENVPNLGSVGAGAAFQSTMGYKFNGATWDRDFKCSQSAPITFAGASGTLQIVGLVNGQIIRVCHVSLAASVATNITLLHGTGTNCGSTSTAFSGAYNNITTLALDFGPEAALYSAASEELCITSSAVVTAGGVVTYAQY